MAGTVGAYQQGAFATPVNATLADATVVLANDNNVRTKHNSHDSDATIHVQSSTLAARPGAGTAQRVWITTDGLRGYVDGGATWSELAYLPLVGGTVTGAVTFSAVVTLSAQPILSTLTASQAVFTDASKGLVSNAITGAGNVVMSTSPTLTGTVAGANATWSGTTLHTGVATFTAQPILSSLTVSQAVFTDGSKGLVSNAITGSGNVVMSASPTLTGTVTAATLNATTLGGILSTAAQPNVTSVGTLTSLASGTISTTGNITLTLGDPIVAWVNTNSGSKTWRAQATDTSWLLTEAGVANQITVAAGGAVAFNGALSGITTLAGTGAVSGFTTATFSNQVTATNFIANTALANQGASRVALTQEGAAISAIWASGTDASTNGTLVLHSVRSNGTNDVAMLSLTSTTAAFGALTLTGGTYNSQIISSAANFTGTMTVASTVTLPGLVKINSPVTTAGAGTNVVFGNATILYWNNAAGSGVVGGLSLDASNNWNSSLVGGGKWRLKNGGGSTIFDMDEGTGTLTLGVGGLTVSSGTTAVQALTATTGVLSSTLQVAGSITSTVTTGQFFLGASATTGSLYFQLANTSGGLLFGLNNSTGGTLGGGTGTAYATTLVSNSATALEIGTNNQIWLGIVGAAGTPANSSVGNIFIPNGTAPTGNPTGKLYIWAAAGAGLARGTGGTVTTWAPA